MGIIFFEIIMGKSIKQMRKDKLIENKPPGLNQGFFGKIAILIPNEDLKNLVGKLLDEKAENRFDSKTV